MAQVDDDKLAHAIDSCIEYIFECSIDHLRTIHKPISKLSLLELTSMLELVDENLHSYYQLYHGPKWKIDKLQEMQESGLVYVWYRSHIENDQMVGFISFKVVTDEVGIGSVLYLYEIQVRDKYRRKKIGMTFMNNLEKLILYLRQSKTDSYDTNLKITYLDPNRSLTEQEISGIALTVFSENTIAFNWYLRLGYQLAPSSPRDKVLRNGKVIKPDYYILYKQISS